MRVKFFATTIEDATEFERKVNTWLEANPNIDIHDTVLSTNLQDFNISIVCMVLYEAVDNLP